MIRFMYFESYTTGCVVPVVPANPSVIVMLQECCCLCILPLVSWT